MTTPTTAYDFDLFTIGGGSGGVRAARFAAAAGARSAIAEEGRFGGTCVNVGCVPKKLLSYAAHVREDFHDAAGFGWSGPAPGFDWPTLIANKDREIARLNGIYEQVLAKAGVEILKGRASLVDPHTVEVGGRRITARHILVATGGRPERDTRPGAAEHGLVSDDLFQLPALPRRVLIAGGGYIAVEFAGIFHGLGSQVTQIYRGELFLRGFDDDVRRFLKTEMEKKGIRLVFGAIIERIEKTAAGYACHLSNGAVELYDAVVYAIGRKPNVAGLGLEQVGVRLNDRGAIAVDAYSRTSVPSIHAIGDVTDRVNLTPVALAEGMALVKTLFQGKPTAMDYADIPTAVFSHPPIGTVGLTEAQARARFGAVDIYRSEFKPLKHTLSGNAERTLMKLVVDARSDRVVGAHMVGIDAPEIVQGLGIALKAGATKADFDATIGIHPTAAEEFVTMRDKLAQPAAKAAE
jgi:glutathione reductase (NADPH)